MLSWGSVERGCVESRVEQEPLEGEEGGEREREGGGRGEVDVTPQQWVTLTAILTVNQCRP